MIVPSSVLFYQGFQLSSQTDCHNYRGVEWSRLTGNSYTHLEAPRAQDRGATLLGRTLGTTVLNEETTIQKPRKRNTSGASTKVRRWEGGGRKTSSGHSRGAGPGQKRGGDRVDSQIQELTDRPRVGHRGGPREPLPRSQGRPNPARDRPSTPTPHTTRRT